MPGAPTAPVPKPSRSGGLLELLRKPIDYGTFLAGTLRQRGLGNHPDIQGRLFGTTNVTLILARIARGLLSGRPRAQAASQRRPPRRPALAARRLRPPGIRRDRTPAPRARSTPRCDDDDTALLAQMPTPEQIAAEIRRRPIGEVIADICRDLSLVPAHPLWQELQLAIIRESGRYAALVMDILKRRQRMPIPEDRPEELPPSPWATWRCSPEPAGTGPP